MKQYVVVAQIWRYWGIIPFDRKLSVDFAKGNSESDVHLLLVQKVRKLYPNHQIVSYVIKEVPNEQNNL